MGIKNSVLHRNKSVLAALMKFRLIINSVKRHYQWVEKQSGIKGAQLWALWELYRTPGLRVSELGKVMAIQQPTASNLVDKLVKSKLIVRRRSTADQREVRLFVTNTGRKLIKQAPKPSRGLLPEALYGLPQNKLEQLNELLKNVLEGMGPIDKKSMKKPLSDVL